MSDVTKPCAGRKIRPVHGALFKGFVAAAVGLSALGALPAVALAQPAPANLAATIRSTKIDRDIRAFYEARGHRPLWIHESGLGPEAERLLELVETAEIDGLNPGDYKSRSLGSTLRKAWGGSPKALAKAEIMLSQTFAAYVRDARQPRNLGMLYVDPAVSPVVPSKVEILQWAAAASSLEQYLGSMGWMHPIYGQLRQALMDRDENDAAGRLLRLNLERARALPAMTRGRHVLVDAAGARLYMYENGRISDSMRVVVGKADQQTPMMAGMIRYAIVNPYWNIPPDLAQTSVAPNVLSKGLGFLKTKRYEVLSDWSDKPRVLDPRKIDWRAVADGQRELRIRQLPGAGNAMGKMKFMFPNDLGIYLHDTPEKELLREASRQFSSGCVRLEDAPRLAKWLFGKPLVAKSKAPEQQVQLPDPVPVYITYLTAAPEGENIAFRRDIYNRDGALMARMDTRAFATR